MGIYKRLFTPLVNNVWSSLVSSSGRVGEPWTIFSRGLAAKPFREGGLQQQLNVNVQFEPVVNCGNVVNRQALPSFMGPKAYFAGFLNVHGNSSVQACSYHVRCYSSTGKVALMDKRNIQDHKRRLLAAKYEIKRVLYKAALRDPNLPRDLWVKFRTKLSKLPRNSSFTRTRNRCILTGRSRAVYRKFRMSRICFRELASKGEIMGVRKASW
ncbi:uncharacterized protein LOC131035285 [Cryptomeria japonica]|uniref:uncharacterized protein LOC131035285 n=1 Tax=Cryptomeria japonica TaxID=3369 RepID=UPI0027DA2A5C|nr:uncharacterized protein LOC131035285 [Cryptomeria japonica]XP_059067283.1 uncharacterized protein LOC131035285 [Cryptomeria japonica]